MNRFFKHISLLLLLIFSMSVSAQINQWRDMHKVKRHETVFGIANQYGITIDELMNANPDMKVPGYELKKGSYVCIPYSKDQQAAMKGANGANDKKTSLNNKTDIRKRAIRVGVMLPLHDNDGDGRRMVEYYRGLLMACDSLKKEGVSLDIHAWNVSADADIRLNLIDNAAQQCDVIFGPLYSSQVKALSEFATKYNIKVVIPFSIISPEVYTNRNLFQIYQSSNDLNETTVSKFLDRFPAYHPVFIDCNDTTSKKGLFTFALRRQLEARGIAYSLTNLKSGEEQFAKAFSRTKPNVVILNTGRSPELNVAFAKLNGMLVKYPGTLVSLFGYTEWLMYTQYNLDNFYKFDTYIPSTFYYNPLSAKTKRIEQKYRWNFHSDMMQSLPRFAITGFDYSYFFLKGLHSDGKDFNGTTRDLNYIQNPLHFSRIGAGGWLNKSFMFVHYTYNRTIETINY